LDLDDQNTKETSDRELKEETGIDVESKYVVLSGEVGVFSELGRDPRGRYISIAYYYLLSEKPELKIDPEEIESYKWFKVDSLKESEISFDHYEMIQKANEKLKQNLRLEK
jgi:8-oxo-dGTP diphosphatase